MAFEIYKNLDVINKLLEPTVDLKEIIGQNSKLAIFVHSSKFKKFKRIMENKYVNIIEKYYDYQLKVDKTIYDMKLVYLKVNSPSSEREIRDFLYYGQYHFDLERLPNLFISENRYHELQEFIRVNHLGSLIVKTETKPGYIFRDTNITVVTFKKHVAWLIEVNKFREFLHLRFSPPTPNYYQAIAFPWLQPLQLKHFETSIHPKSFFIVHQFLTCLRELSYGDIESHVNVFDLCNLRLAFCDERDMNEYNTDLAYEIDSLIIWSMNKLKIENKLFANNQFNANQYLIDRNMSPYSYETVQYFQYKFQDYFDSIEMPFQYKFKYLNEFAPPLFESNTFINLADHPDLEILSQMPRTRFTIYCFNYNQMNIFKLIELLNHRNVMEITLDTNQKWLDLTSIESENMKTSNNYRDRSILLFGNNTHNFVEKCLIAMKEFKIWPQLWLNSPLQNVDLLNETEFSKILFYDILIDSRMLEQVYRLNYTKFEFFICYLENKITNWDIIYAMDHLNYALIIEEESTWQTLIEFISKKLVNSDLEKIKFKNLKLKRRDTSDERIIDLSIYTFVYNSRNVVVEGTDSNMLFDLLNIEKEIVVDDKSDYEFYT